MAKATSGGVVRQVQALWDVGAIGDLDDGDLLDLFLRRDATAEAAFASLVDRHGPMVYRVCRDVLDRQSVIETLRS